MISLFEFRGALELGLAYSLMTLGIFVSYRILDIADLTVDGSFTLGAIISALLTINGHPILGILGGCFAGGCAGLITAFLHTKLKVQAILAGILTMTALYSINLRIMVLPNVSLIGKKTIFNLAEKFIPKNYTKITVTFIIVLIVAVLLVLFLNTHTGMALRATGDNEDMVRSSSIDAERTKTIGLAIANAVVGISGAVTAQMQLFADMRMGIGMVIIGLASLIIGEVLLGRRSIFMNIIAVIAGSVVYKVIIAVVLHVGVAQQDLKLISSVIVAGAISYPAIKSKISIYKLKKRGVVDAKLK